MGRQSSRMMWGELHVRPASDEVTSSAAIRNDTGAHRGDGCLRNGRSASLSKSIYETYSRFGSEGSRVSHPESIRWSESLRTVGKVLPQVFPPSFEVLIPTLLNRFSLKMNGPKNVMSPTKNGLLAIYNLVGLEHAATGLP